jgi:hypothetical protein
MLERGRSPGVAWVAWRRERGANESGFGGAPAIAEDGRCTAKACAERSDVSLLRLPAAAIGAGQEPSDATTSGLLSM